MRKALLLVLTLFHALVCLAAEPYPSKTVRVIAPFAPGGTIDFTGRIISQQLTEQLGRSFVVENRTGASGTIAAAMVAKSAPDGYTLMVMDTSGAVVPSLFKSLPYDVARDFVPITQIMAAPTVLVVGPSVKSSTLKEFIALAQANPGKFNYGSSGAGSQNQLSAELFNRAARVSIAHIPYKGGGEALAAVISGQVAMTIAPITTVLSLVKGAKVRPLAITTDDGKRSPALPDVPSMSEAGVSGNTVSIWVGLVAPAGLAQDIVNKLHAEVVKAIAVPSVRERFVVQGGEVVGSNPEEFAMHIRNETQRWADIIKSAGITAE